MGRIVISTNASLDGVVEDPTGEEGFERGGWFTRSAPADLAAWADVEREEAFTVDALLLGRRTDAWFAPRWTPRRDPWADRLNALPKYVVSTSPEPARWTNTTVLGGDAVTEAARLKERLDGDIVVYASYRLGHVLLEHDLVDEVRLFVFPVVVGGGRRLFGEPAAAKPMHLVESRSLGAGLVHVTYRPVGVSR